MIPAVMFSAEGLKRISATIRLLQHAGHDWNNILELPHCRKQHSAGMFR
ncbi:MAG: hypothetical protein QW470_00220 [Candidatus Caldarchaeum sp.]